MGAKRSKGTAQPYRRSNGSRSSETDRMAAWEAFVAQTGGAKELSGRPWLDRAADDIYLPKNLEDRAAVKRQAMQDPLTKSAIAYRTQLAVGQIRIKPTPMYRRLGWSEEDNRRVRREIKELVKMYLESDRNFIDIQGKLNLTGMATQHTQIFSTEGEAMAAVFELGESRRSPMSFALGNIDPDRVRNPVNLDAVVEGLRDGILTSKLGGANAYFVHDYHRNSRYSQTPAGRGSGFRSGADNYRVIRKRNSETGRTQFVHSYVQQTSDLSRGVSDLAACLTLSCQKQEYINASLEDAISKAGLTFVLKSNATNLQDLMGVLDDGRMEDPMLEYMRRSKAHNDNMELSHKGNKIARLLHGEDLGGFSADQAGGATFETFSDTLDIIAASCHGLSLEEYRQRWNDTNFSGARSGKLYVWNMIQALRREASWNFSRTAYGLALEDFILQGHLQLPGFGEDFMGAHEFFVANREAISCVDFFGSPRDEIDLEKTATRYLTEMKLGVGTRESYCNEVLGVDAEERAAQIIEEVKSAYEMLADCGHEPEWSVAEMATLRMFPEFAWRGEAPGNSSGTNVEVQSSASEAEDQENIDLELGGELP